MLQTNLIFRSDQVQFCKQLPEHNLHFAFHETSYKAGFSYSGCTPLD